MRRWLALAAAALLADMSAAQMLVTRARGPSAARLPVGSTVAQGTRLIAGDHLEVLTPDGVLKLDGPTQVGLGARAQKQRPLADFVGGLLERRERLRSAGAIEGQALAGLDKSAGRPRYPLRPTRGVTPLLAQPPRNLWAIDAAEGGRSICYADDAPVQLVRGAMLRGDLIVETTVGPLAWRAGEETLLLPPTAERGSGSLTVVDAAGKRPFGTMTLTPVGAPASLDALAKALHDRGCDRQLGSVLDLYAESAAR